MRKRIVPTIKASYIGQYMQDKLDDWRKRMKENDALIRRYGKTTELLEARQELYDESDALDNYLYSRRKLIKY